MLILFIANISSWPKILITNNLVIIHTLLDIYVLFNIIYEMVRLNIHCGKLVSYQLCF